MTTIAPVIIVLLVMVILGLMQFSPGLFAIFYHQALGKYSRTKADNLSLDYILGAETASAILWFSLYIIFFIIFYHSPSFAYGLIPWILSGAIFAESILVLLFYYRKGHSTALFPPRNVTKTLLNNTARVKTRQDSFFLGFVSIIPELPFTFPLYLTAIYILAYSTFIPTAITIIIFVIITTLQLFFIRTAYRLHHNLADIQHFRVKAKSILRFMLPILYLLLALTIIYLGVTHNG